MSIATAIENAQQKVEACYTQVATQGGTIPTTKNLANLPQAISTVSESYIPNYIAPKDTIGGMYKPDNTATSFNLKGATDITEGALYCAFYNCSNLTSIDVSSLTTISSDYAMYSCFYNCTRLTSIDLSLLTTISGSNAMGKCFQLCTGLTTVDLGLLTTVSGSYAMSSCFSGCTGLTTVTIGGATAIDFGTRKTQFSSMFSGCNQASGIDLYIATTEATLSTFTGYPSFGASCEVRIHYTAQ